MEKEEDNPGNNLGAINQDDFLNEAKEFFEVNKSEIGKAKKIR